MCGVLLCCRPGVCRCWWPLSSSGVELLVLLSATDVYGAVKVPYIETQNPLPDTPYGKGEGGPWQETSHSNY